MVDANNVTMIDFFISSLLMRFDHGNICLSFFKNVIYLVV